MTVKFGGLSDRYFSSPDPMKPHWTPQIWFQQYWRGPEKFQWTPLIFKPAQPLPRRHREIKALQNQSISRGVANGGGARGQTVHSDTKKSGTGEINQVGKERKKGRKQRELEEKRGSKEEEKVKKERRKNGKGKEKKEEEREREMEGKERRKRIERWCHTIWRLIMTRVLPLEIV